MYHIGMYKMLATEVSGLQLGSGFVSIPGFWNIDSDYFLNPDIVAGVEKIKLADNAVQTLYCVHILEHVDRTKKMQILREWFRVLKPGGSLYVAVPDFEALAKFYLSCIEQYDIEKNRAIADRIMRVVHGGQAHKADKHNYGYSFSTLSSFLTMAGFTHVEKFDTYHLPFTRDRDDDSTFSIDGRPLLLNVKATK